MSKRTYWDAEVYEKIGTPMRGWAQKLIEDLGLRGDETVLDAGCGSGSVTFDLLEKLPNGKIYALDSSPEMVAQISKSVAERGITNVFPSEADLTNFTLPEPVDVVFSNAVFHWIPDDDGLFGSLYRAAKPGGRLRAQCGGYGNNVRLFGAAADLDKRQPYAEHLAGKDLEPRTYRRPEEAIAALERNGWTDVRAELFESPVVFEDDDSAVLYLRTIMLQPQIERLPEDLSEPFLRDVIAEVIARHGEPFVADYVRLDLWAQRGA